MRLWETSATPVDAAILAFTAGDDPRLDLELVPFDCLASAAHAEMLAAIGLLPADDLSALKAALREAYAKASTGRFEIRPEQEDAHTALEEFLTARCGEAGRRIHTGRSRNDQVIAALRLLARERLLEVADLVLELADGLAALAHTHHRTPMPGFTHTRRAMPSTAGHLLASAAEGLLRDLEALEPALQAASRGALGSAAGYGVPLPLDRELTARLLGCDTVDQNTIHVQNTRGRLESQVLFGLHQLALTLGRLATDLVWLSSEGFGFFKLPVELTTGSSIMPQKRNPDVFELVRALPAALLARYVEVTSTLHGLPAGYQRDLQRTKGPLLAGLAQVRSGLQVMTAAAARLAVDEAACRAACTPELLATDAALARVVAGTPFRDAYRAAKTEAASPEPGRGASAIDLDAALAARTHLGAPGTDPLPGLRALAEAARARLGPFAAGATTARRLLAL